MICMTLKTLFLWISAILSLSSALTWYYASRLKVYCGSEEAKKFGGTSILNSEKNTDKTIHEGATVYKQTRYNAYAAFIMAMSVIFQVISMYF